MFQEGKATWTTGSINVGLNALALSKAGVEPISTCHQNTRGQAYLNLRTETKKAKILYNVWKIFNFYATIIW